MDENGQNGCKVFASIAKFGQTKFQPIRKHENNVVKETTIVHPSKRTKIEENQQPKSRVNKFFKSRNPTSVLEETNKAKSVTANITPIKNEPKFRQEDKPKYKEDKPKYKEEKPLKIKEEKPLKIKIKREKKESPTKVEKLTKQPVKLVRQLEESPYVRPTIKSPPAVSNQTRYSTRSRREPINVYNENNQVNQLNEINQPNEDDNRIEQSQHHEIHQIDQIEQPPYEPNQYESNQHHESNQYESNQHHESKRTLVSFTLRKISSLFF